MRQVVSKYKQNLVAIGLASLCASLMEGTDRYVLPSLYAKLPGGLWFYLLAPMPSTVTNLAITWAFLAFHKRWFDSLGLAFSPRCFGRMGLGFLVGLAVVGGSILILLLAGGARLQVNPGVGFGHLMIWFWVFLNVAIAEEVMFRGYAFQRLVDGLGLFWAQIILGFFFAASHWGGGRGDLTFLDVKVTMTINTALFAIMAGLAAARTRSLAIPIGMHLAANWVQGPVFGLAVSGSGRSIGPVRTVVDAAWPKWITGGAYGIEASVFLLVAQLAVIAYLVGMKPTVDEKPAINA